MSPDMGMKYFFPMPVLFTLRKKERLLQALEPIDLQIVGNKHDLNVYLRADDTDAALTVVRNIEHEIDRCRGKRNSIA